MAGIKKILRLTVAAAAFVPAHAEEAVLATADGEPAVTEGDLYSYARGIYKDVGRAPVTAADVEDVVNTLVTAKVLVLEAEESGYADDEIIKQKCAGFRRGLLHDEIWEELLNEEPITEEELRAFYEKDTRWRKYSFLEVKNREVAETAYRELLAVRPWDEVVREYSIHEQDKETAGYSRIPMAYDGKAASRVVFATPAGGYTPPVAANDDIRWQIYRVDKIVHGRTDTYEEARPKVNAAVEAYKGTERWRKHVAELRKTYEVTRNEEMWRDLQNVPFSAFREKWGTPDAVVSDVGGVPVKGSEFVFLIVDFLYLGDEAMDAYRAEDPADFAYVTDRILTRLENEALVEYGALVQGVDKEPSFIRSCERYRDEILTDLFVTKEFVAKLSPITDADCEIYYENHKEEFEVPEAVEVYMVAMPDREDLEDFYSRILAGADLVDTGEAYNLARGEELMDMYEPPPELPPQEEEWLGVVRILREPDPNQPDGPFAAELRPRAFPFTKLKELSDIFQLSDGRWAFYAPIYYQPFRRETLDDAGTKLKCQKKAWAEFYVSDEVDKLSREWLASLRAKRNVEVARERFDEVAASLNAAE